jgi:glutamine amidotransferase
MQHVAAGSGFDVVVTSRAEDVMAARRIVLPGQGAPWPTCIRELRRSVCCPPCCMLQRTSLFGVCVMQMLLTHSAEGVPGDGGAGTPA